MDSGSEVKKTASGQQHPAQRPDCALGWFHAWSPGLLQSGLPPRLFPGISTETAVSPAGASAQSDGDGAAPAVRNAAQGFLL